MPGQTTNFILTEDQERKLVEYCLERLTSLKASNAERIRTDAFGWTAYENERKDRTSGVWRSNKNALVLPLTSMIIDAAVAKAEDDILDTDPFLKFTAIGPGDEAQAEQCTQYLRWKFGPRGANLKKTFQDGMLPTFIQRAVIYKVMHVDRRSEWLDMDVPVLHQMDESGQLQPIQTIDSAGEPSFIAEDQASWIEHTDPKTGGPVLDSVGQPIKVLSTDPSVFFDSAKSVFQKPQQGMLRSRVAYRGAKAVLVDSDSFFCPPNVASIEDADFKAEIYDKGLSFIEGIYVERPWLRWADAKARIEANAEAKGQSDTKRNSDSNESLDFDSETKVAQLVECWVKRDVLGWGRPQEFMILIEPESRTAVFYEFQAKLCPDFQCPFVSVSVSRHKGYWWGYSLPEKIKQFQDYIDLQFARHSARNSRNANPIGAMNPNAVEENPSKLIVGDGGLYKLKAGKNISDFIQWSAIPNLDLDTKQLVDWVIYMVQKWLAISDIGQGDYSDLPQNSTKYGIQATQKESNKINRKYGRRLIDGYEAVADKMVKLQLDQLDGEEVFEVTEGKATALLTMDPDTVRQYGYNVAVEVGQDLTEDDVNAAEKALEVQQRYFDIVDPMRREASRPILAKILERLNFKDADRLLPVVQSAPIMPTGESTEAMP